MVLEDLPRLCLGESDPEHADGGRVVREALFGLRGGGASEEWPGVEEGVLRQYRGRGPGGWSHCGQLGPTSLGFVGHACLLRSKRV